nr:PREDICTED: trimeric intracellular cation channel type B-A-like [Paralichthys olivaceus]
MDVLWMLRVDELSHALANLSMFPFFDVAHYVVSVMALREQPGALEVSRVSPLACWFSSMLFCFGGAVLSGIMLAEPPIAPLTNSTSVLLASVICPTKITLIGAVLFTLQQTHYLPLQKHHLMLLYTAFTVVNKTRMMLTGSNVSPFAVIESAVYKTLFTGYSPYAALTGEEQKTCIDTSRTSGTSSSLAKTKESNGKGAAGKRTPAPQSESLEAKKESENTETTNCKKMN